MKRQQSLLFKQRRPLITDKRAVIRGIVHLFFLGFLIGAPMLIYVWTRVEVIKLNYVMLDIKNEERRLFIKNERLKVELAMLMSPSRLSDMAESEFKLKNPSRSQIVHIK